MLAEARAEAKAEAKLAAKVLEPPSGAAAETVAAEGDWVSKRVLAKREKNAAKREEPTDAGELDYPRSRAIRAFVSTAEWATIAR